MWILNIALLNKNREDALTLQVRILPQPQLIMDMKTTGVSKERALVRAKLINGGDKLIFSTKVYNKLRRILIEENRDARIEGMIKKNEVLFSIKKMNDREFEVRRNA